MDDTNHTTQAASQIKVPINAVFSLTEPLSQEKIPPLTPLKAGTLHATKELIENLGGEVVGAAFYIELTDLKGREQFPDLDIYSLVKYHSA